MNQPAAHSPAARRKGFRRPPGGRLTGGRAATVTAAVAAIPVMAVALAGPALAQRSAAVGAPVPARIGVVHPGADHLGSTVRDRFPAARLTPQRVLAAPPRATAGGSAPYGMDVSSYQGNVDWGSAAAGGATFAYVKASEATGYLNPYFRSQYDGSYAAGLIHGAYHFALPNDSSGAAQANYFIAHGGSWVPDGHTLPPMLDVEYNPYGPSCYGLTPTQMSSWIREFSTTVHARTRQYPAIYSTADWWNTCTARDGSFAATNPLYVANYSGSVGTLPAGWEHQTIWQYADHGTYPGDADVFNGTLAQLHAFADALPAQQLSFGAPDPLAARYTQLGGAGSYLGNPVGAQYPITGGIGQNYKAGRMYYTPATGAHALRGAILAGYLTLGGPAGPVGVPTTDELASADSAAGTTTSPDRAASQSTGPPPPEPTRSKVLSAPVGQPWAGNRAALGYPTSNKYPVTGGRRSDFGRGSITWTAAGLLRSRTSNRQEGRHPSPSWRSGLVRVSRGAARMQRRGRRARAGGWRRTAVRGAPSTSLERPGPGRAA